MDHTPNAPVVQITKLIETGESILAAERLAWIAAARRPREDGGDGDDAGGGDGGGGGRREASAGNRHARVAPAN